MSRSILEIAQEAAERDTIAPAPTTLFGTNDRVAKSLRNAAKDTVREILRRTNYRGLSEFQSQWALATTAGKYAYSLPPDYLRMIPNTETRGGWPLGLIGPASPQTWAYWIAGLGAVVAPMAWRIKNGILFIEPTPAAAELLVIEYISRYPAIEPVTPDKLHIDQIPVVAQSPYVLRSGMMEGDFATAVEAGNAAYGAPPGYDLAMWGNDVWEQLKTINPLTTEAPLPQLRKEHFTDNTDLTAFKDDYILSLGMSWRLARSLGKPYAELADEYESELEARIASDAGGSRSFEFGHDGEMPETVPLGDGKWLVS
ncbi:MAG: hypothetical protein AAGI03_01875 [Pseudomonadota bacterium]